jgi:prefoldin subunit 5
MNGYASKRVTELTEELQRVNGQIQELSSVALQLQGAILAFQEMVKLGENVPEEGGEEDGEHGTAN